ncbi:MAG: hypothetical protein CVT95_13365, partial [Bacteroidetes bacterium HGW-Bacteroidetes-12]
MKRINNFSIQIIVSLAFTLAAYAILKTANHPAQVDLIIEGVVFTVAGIIGLRGFFSKSNSRTKLFHRFELFYGLTYSIVAISCFLGITYFFKNPHVHEVGLQDVKNSPMLISMSAIKSISFVFMFLAWFFFYQNLKIKAGALKQILAFLIGFGFYFGISLFILSKTGDQSILSLGIIVGAAIGLFAVIALHRATRFLTIIFLLFSTVHLWEFYLMGMHKDLVTG